MPRAIVAPRTVTVRVVAERRVRYLTEFHDSWRWDGFALRPDDIIVTTPPKCGTTWTQTICALLVHQTPDLPESLAVLSPWFEMLTRPRDDVVRDLDAQPFRRVIKSHTPLDGLPWHDTVTYIAVGRDPRDVWVSMDHHDHNFDDDAFVAARRHALGLTDADAETDADATPHRPDSDDPKVRFREWVDNDTPPQEIGSSLRRTLHHLETFWDARDRPNVVLLRYEDMVADLDGAMRALAARLGIAIDEARWPALVRAATIDEMRAHADRFAPNTDTGLFRDPAEFFHAGTSGQWRAVLDGDDLRHYFNRVDELASPALAAWVHHQELTSS
jgi:aryl sulfotransferase